MKHFKIYLHGKDNGGWSIDNDYGHLQRAIETAKIPIGNFFSSNVLHSTRWNSFFEARSTHLRRRKFSNYILTCSNYINPEDERFGLHRERIRAKSLSPVWVAPSMKQCNLLQSLGEKAVFCPFYVSNERFFPLNKTKDEIATSLGIPSDVRKDKFIIGSFQRDSLGSNLQLPKWQKDPQLMIDIINDSIYKDDILLFLAGPRRHYLVQKCKEYGINYYYFGDESYISLGKDDYSVNTLGIDKMNILYNFIDLYVMSSASEGGPKSVLECALSKTAIISTNVGLAADFLDSTVLYDNKEEGVEILDASIKSNLAKKLIELHYGTVNEKNSFTAYTARIRQIYESL